MPSTLIIVDLPELCLRKIFGYLPLCELLRLEQCYTPWLPLIQSVCKCRKQLTIVLSTSNSIRKIDLQRSKIPYSFRPFNDGIPHVDELDPLVIKQVYHPVWQCLPRLDEFDSLTYEWLYEQDSNRILTMMPNIRQLTIAVLEIGCYRYIGDYYWNTKLSVMQSIVKLLDHWAPQLTKLSIFLRTDNHRATLAEVSEDYRLLIKSLNNMPKLSQLALSLDKLFFVLSNDPRDDGISNDEAKLTNLFYHELKFMPKLTHLYLYVNKAMFISLFESSLKEANSLEALVLSHLGNVDARVDETFTQIGSKVVLLPSHPGQINTANLTNLRSLNIQVAFCTELQNNLANKLKPLTKLKQLIHLEIKILSSSDGDIEPIATSQVTIPHLKSVRILSLKIKALNTEQWEQLSDLIDWSRLLPSLTIVIINYKVGPINYRFKWGIEETSVPNCNKSNCDQTTANSGHQLCVCEQWAQRTFDPIRNPNLSALYTRHRDCSRR